MNFLKLLLILTLSIISPQFLNAIGGVTSSSSLVANNDSYTILKNSSLSDNILNNDTGTNLVWYSYSMPEHGTIDSAYTDGDFTYIPDSDYIGNDSFTYSIVDSYGNTDTATVTITINDDNNDDTITISALDICYDPLIEEGFNFGPVGFFNKTSIPLRNIGDEELTNVQVALGTSSLFSAFSGCGVDDGSGTCDDANGASFMVFSAFNDGVLYNLENLSPNENITPYTESTFSLFSTNDFDIVATYSKNGTTYQGVVYPCEEESTGGRDFELRYATNLYGDVKVIGNTVLCELDNNGQCKEPTTTNSNAETNLQKAPQSTAELDLPAGATIQYARLYWQGRLKATSSYTSWDSASKAAVTQIKIKKDDSDYTTIIADVADYNYHTSVHDIRIYHASADVTSFIKSNGEGNYSVDTTSFDTYTGTSWYDDPYDGLGAYGAWVLVVAYEDLNGMYRNISIFDGYKTVSEDANDVDISVEGFITPRSGDVDSQTYVFTAEGDKYISGDHIYMSGKDHPSTPMVDLGTFDSSIDVSANRNPNLINNNGIDIRHYDVGTGGEDGEIITNEETGADFKFTSTQDTYFPSLIVFSTELYVPKFCYDYAYKQQGVYFTEKNDGSHLPYLVGDSYSDVDVTIFIRNLVDSDMQITDMNLSVVDINTSQAIYKRESTMLARDGELIPQPLADSSLNVNDAFIKDIPIGTISSNDFFYLYYTLTPKTSSLDMLLNVQANYTLTFNGTSIPYTLQLGKDMPICSTTNFKYLPANGMFNIVHNDYYDLDNGGTKQYYNLPTQVTSREGNFKLLIMDPNDPDYNTLLDEHDILYTEVEIIDASAFHDTNASCYEPTSTISEKVSLFIDENVTSVPFDRAALLDAIADGRTNLTTSSEFYKTARQNAAFRTIYYENVYDQYNQPAFKKVDGLYEAMWTMDWQGKNCVGDVNGNGESNENDKVMNYCQYGHGLNSVQVEECTKCVSVIKYICSRDNFAIRPEAFMMQINDQNQTSATQKNSITTVANSGSTGAVAPVINLAADYFYNIEVNATNNIDNKSSYGYTRTFELDNSVQAKFFWEPRNGHIVTGCNDTTNASLNEKTQYLRFLDGKLDTNISLNNVGEYRIAFRDTSWTTVDNNATFMTHHTGDYFTTTLDCHMNSDVVLNINASMNPEDSSTLNGCEIRSQHTNNQANLQYNDYNVTFHPYTFSLPNKQTIGMDRNTTINATSYIYYADINNSNNENMSYQIDGLITAKGYNGSSLNNFTANCYATAINLSITTSDSRILNDNEGNPVIYLAKFHDKNASGSIQTALDVTAIDNNPMQALNIPITATHFLSDLNGTINSSLSLNYQRKKNITINPKNITFINYQANCANAALDCTFYADLSTKTSHGEEDLNSSLRHYYGRTHVTRQRFVGEDGTAPLYYEVFCSGNDCNKTLLQNGVSSSTTDDPRWFINTTHTSKFGLPGRINQKTYTIGNGYVQEIVAPTGNAPDSITLHYNGERGYPYKTTMENNASSWLIYNQFDATSTKNEFEVEFNNADSAWAGKRETDDNTNRNATDTTNRRTMW